LRGAPFGNEAPEPYGKGYPDGLTGDAIPLPARIISVADTFEAMTSDRPYRKALSFEQSVAEVTRCLGSQFDPRVVEAFLVISSEMKAADEDKLVGDKEVG
jgi:HD-GYP domain-containing protein (c-di-GMP phosphodiesterase class II)